MLNVNYHDKIHLKKYVITVHFKPLFIIYNVIRLTKYVLKP